MLGSQRWDEDGGLETTRGRPQSLLWYERALPSYSPAIAIEIKGRWDLNLARCLSAATGGFAVAFESARVLGYQGIALFYAGHTIEAWGEDAEISHRGIDLAPAPPDRELYDLFADHVHAVSGLLLPDLDWDDDTVLRLISLEPQETPFDPYQLLSTEKGPFTRAVLANVDEVAFSKTVAGLPIDRRGHWRWLAQQTPYTEIPYILLQRSGAFDSALLATLAQQTKSYAAGVELGTAGGLFSWVWIDPGGAERSGTGRGAAAFISLWRDVAVIMGTTPDVMAWPNGLDGHSLNIGDPV